MPKIIHEKAKCIGCGVCASVCPNFFEMSQDDGLATLKNSKEENGFQKIETNEVDCAKEAADICPVKIITVEE